MKIKGAKIGMMGGRKIMVFQSLPGEYKKGSTVYFHLCRFTVSDFDVVQ